MAKVFSKAETSHGRCARASGLSETNIEDELARCEWLTEIGLKGLSHYPNLSWGESRSRCRHRIDQPGVSYIRGG